MGNCVHHDEFIYDNSVPGLSIHTPSEVALMLNKLECDATNYPERREEFERHKNKFKWICCDTTVTAGSGVGGCKKKENMVSMRIPQMGNIEIGAILIKQ
ncbi:unnamed protein product [Rotaria socialis]|uniref:Uncharacterized protein n=1 Tax=Rotaria socialis TaxID=392032 RepID=A0A818AL92_9BILA|nr:unnamed protein product [Rotaria socialis]CAF3408650.1 unnamed protein product [Rotaria socialis]CAF3444888.1 unnamed protein product [Rotaria socialis]CAF3515792.1 unnamed protein product [Rotaria socialis]CAF3713457.1 unnamed protein product [Rotaria socialis]